MNKLLISTLYTVCSFAPNLHVSPDQSNTMTVEQAHVSKWQLLYEHVIHEYRLEDKRCYAKAYERLSQNRGSLNEQQILNDFRNTKQQLENQVMRNEWDLDARQKNLISSGIINSDPQSTYPNLITHEDESLFDKVRQRECYILMNISILNRTHRFDSLDRTDDKILSYIDVFGLIMCSMVNNMLRYNTPINTAALIIICEYDRLAYNTICALFFSKTIYTDYPGIIKALYKSLYNAKYYSQYLYALLRIFESVCKLIKEDIELLLSNDEINLQNDMQKIINQLPLAIIEPIKMCEAVAEAQNIYNEILQTPEKFS